MFPARFRQLAEKLDTNIFKCEYWSKCDHFKDDSETCTKSIDKRYCGTYKDFLRDNL